MENNQIQQIAIFGYADTKPGEELYESVVKVTKALAEAGYTVVDGGGPGVMRAATEGAKQGGGHVIGVTFYPKDSMDFEGRDLENRFDEEIKTQNYVERTLTLLRKGQVYVIFKGGTGTISEFGMAWGLARLYFGHHKPLILYGRFWENIINNLSENMLLRPEELKVFKVVDSPLEVLQAIKEFEEEIQKGEHKHLKISESDFSI
ncbi:LOG family protein [Candidatus Daviesbacteria bacterium]|nr:LOG family protein [Candidatus Daviesbacteria bacterium]